ncbi:hypothetical protein PSEUDO9AG_60259 [Pseudomonas sp. 9Ag]|nr:hypothetical protein PSEUDO9AG_60259 [Pseudomonas sp. 9Ag]
MSSQSPVRWSLHLYPSHELLVRTSLIGLLLGLVLKPSSISCEVNAGWSLNLSIYRLRRLAWSVTGAR